MPSFRYTATDSAGSQTTRVVRTRRVSDKELLFFFSQISALIKAGIAPFAAFRSVGGRLRNKTLRKACEDMASETERGTPASSVMEKYIDIFPHNAVATIRAGEYGGFLPEAFRFLSDQYSESAAFKRWFWILKYISWRSLLMVALIVPVMPAFWTAFQMSDVAPVTFLRIYLTYVWRIALPTLLIVCLLILAVMAILRSHTFTQFRHRFVLNLPFGIGRRSRNESLRAFLWTMRNLSNAGLPPNVVWPLAAGSAPNAEYSVRLAHAGKVLRAEKRLSDAMLETNLFPEDYDQLMRTAEVTGDITGTLDNMIKLTSEDYEIAKTESRAGLSQLGCLIMLIVAGLIAIIVGYMYYGKVFDEVNKWIGE